MFRMTKRKLVCVLVLVCVFLMAAAGVSASSGNDFFKTYQSRLAKPVKNNPRILMVGNSHTYYNNLPGMLKKICKSGGINAYIESFTIGGHTLYQWAYPGNLSKKEKEESQKLFRALRTKKWDYVVLQGGTIEPVAGSAKMSKAVAKLVSMIKKSKAQVVFYQTWAPQKGHSHYSKYASKVSGVSDYQKKVIKKYNSLAKKYKAAVAPSGIAFRRAVRLLPGTTLYNADKKHASKAGSYLSACVLYSTMFRRKATGTISLAGEFGSIKQPGVVKELQQIAADVTIRSKKPNNARISMKASEYIAATNTSKQIQYKLMGKTANTRISSWRSDNRRVATVSEKGVVTARMPGTATITAVLNNGKSASCKITVVDKLTETEKVKATDISFQNIKNASAGYSVKKGKEYTLKVSFKPENVTVKDLNWTSSNPKVVKVTQTGKIKGLKKGTAVIKAGTKDGSNLSISVKITVK